MRLFQGHLISLICLMSPTVVIRYISSIYLIYISYISYFITFLSKLLRNGKKLFQWFMIFLRCNFIFLNSWIPCRRPINKSIPNEVWKERIRNSYYRLMIFVIICFDCSINLEIIRVPNNYPPGLFFFFFF